MLLLRLSLHAPLWLSLKCTHILICFCPVWVLLLFVLLCVKWYCPHTCAAQVLPSGQRGLGRDSP